MLLVIGAVQIGVGWVCVTHGKVVCVPMNPHGGQGIA